MSTYYLTGQCIGHTAPWNQTRKATTITAPHGTEDLQAYAERRCEGATGVEITVGSKMSNGTALCVSWDNQDYREDWRERCQCMFCQAKRKAGLPTH